MSGLWEMLSQAFVVDHATGDIVGVVVGVDTSGNRMKVKMASMDDDEVWDDDPDDPEKEDIPEEEPEVKTKAKGTISEKIVELRKAANE